MNNNLKIDLSSLELLLREVQKPGRYTGGEWNQIKKDPNSVKVKVALAFPEVYEIGMSYLGQKILYNLLNQRPDVLAERVYAPWPDFEAQLRRTGFPLFSLENRLPLSDFDFIGFSLLYELNNTNLLTILDLGQIPFLSADRNLIHPLVIAGGPASLNPEPLADFIDFFVFGDGEQVFFEIIDQYLLVKDEVKSREELLRSFVQIPGVYLPMFYRLEKQQKSFLLVSKPQAGFPDRIEKRIVHPLEKALPPDKFITPLIRTVFDRLQVEVARGCPQNCRFCQATSIYFPYRFRSLEEVVDVAYSGLVQTGYDDVSFNALSIGDYNYLEKSIEILMPFLEAEKISVSLPSLRPGKLSRQVVNNIVKIRKTGFTLVPEAGSERLRQVINKKVSDEELMAAARYAFEHGWRLLKLYFMIGLPGETEADLKAIIDLISRLIDEGEKIAGISPAINLSVSSFIPKPHTPFQWLGMDEDKVLLEKKEFIKKNIRRWKKVKLKEHRVETSILEAVFSRGDRKLCSVLKDAYFAGARFDGWVDLFHFDIWEKAFEKNAVDYHRYLGEIDLETELPWDIVNVGLKKSHLKKELQAALEAQYTPGCRETRCVSCQACVWPEYKAPDYKTYEPILSENRTSKTVEVKELTRKKPVRYRTAYQKAGTARFIAHNDLINQIERAFRRAGFRMGFSIGFHPKMMISYGPALPLGMAALAEVLEFKALEIISGESFLERINSCLPSGLRFIGIKECSDDCWALFRDISRVVYSLDLNDPLIKAADGIIDKLDSTYLSEFKEKYQGKVDINFKPEINKLWFYLDFNSEKPLRIQDIVEQLFGLKNSIYVLTREFLMFRNGIDSRNLR
jgi:radical SAM family uncharacterized protein/radical SAM-linked protein